MKKRSMFSKSLAAVLALVILIGLMPVSTMAAGETTDTSDTNVTPQGDLYLDKTAVLQPDGTWTITLEAYATGVVETEVRTQVTPTDIILVLDQSGSMTSKNVTAPGSYTPTTSSVTNETLLSSSSYYYKVGNQYFKINSEKVTVTGTDKYWEYYDAANATAKTTPEADPNNLINNSWTAGGSTYDFATGTGYYSGQYMVYQLATKDATGSIFGYEYTYTAYLYEYVSGSSYVPGSVTPEDTGNNRSQAQALSALEDLWSGWSVTTSGDYALVYLPATLEDSGYYYYRYYYTDASGSKVYLDGTSENSAANPNIDDATYWGTLYTYQSGGEVKRLVALKSAATTFVNDIRAAAQEHQVDHRIAVVGFSGNGVSREADGVDYQYVNSELFIGSNQYNYYDGAAGEPASSYYAQAFQSVNTTKGYDNLTASIGALEGNGPTYASVGFLLAQGVAVNNANITNVTDENGNVTGTTNDYISGKRKLVVVFMTDGEPGWSGYESGENDLINVSDTDKTINGTGGLAKELEDTFGATIYTVALLDSAPSDGGNVDNFLNNATSDGVTGTGNNRYTLATDGVSLTKFFHTIEIEVDTTISTVELTKNAYMVDRVSEHFNMPGLEKQGENETDEAYRTRIANWFNTYVSVYTAAYDGLDENGKHKFAARSDDDVTVKYDATVSDPENDTSVHIWPTFSDSDNTAHGITVHNFNYLADENMVRTEGNVNKGRKLVIVIRGITAKDSAAQDIGVYTNNEHSGLWDMGDTGAYGKLKAFPMPTALLANRVYVLDYAKEALLDTTSSVRRALALNTTLGAVAYTATENGNVYTDTTLNTSSSAVKYGDAKIENGKLYYTPKTMNWDGYDSFYVFWHSNSDDVNTGAGDASTGYGWSKVSVIPANNVYYEDTFVSTKIDGEYVDSTTNGRVGIEFGSGWTFTEVDTDGNPKEGTNDELPEGSENSPALDSHGWIDSLADDTTFSDGTVAKGDGTNNTASATFSFTGTGMDIYSYTDTTTGTIMVIVAPDEETVPEGYSVPTRYIVVDNYAASADDPNTEAVEGYYQIPTVSYIARGTKNAVLDEDGNVVTPAEKNVLVHATYNVTIYVTNEAAKDGNRVTYYLDGIRVYNPLSDAQEDNLIVNSGYGDEVHAFFYNVRDYLLDAEHFKAEYTVSFDPNYGENSTDESANVTVDSVQVTYAGVDLSACGFTAPKGMQFAGWSLTADGEILSGEHSVTKNTTLYAIWEAVPESGTTEGSGTETASDTESSTEDTTAETTPAYELKLIAKSVNFESGAVLIDQVKNGQHTEAGTPLHTNVIGVYETYGPKNEVYLAVGQQIVMKVDYVEGRRWFVSLKSPTGNATEATVSNTKSVNLKYDIEHSSDLYYEVFPVENTVEATGEKYYTICIQNSGSAMLSVTKYQITGIDVIGDFDQNGISLLAISEDEAVNAASAFSLRRSVSAAEIEEEIDSGSTDVEITNPDADETPSKEEQIAAQIEALVNKLFNSIRNWFNS